MPTSESPRFLETAARTSKPRRDGITHVIDKGTSPAAIKEFLEAHGSLIDVWKFGFGTAYVDGTVGAKVELLRGHGVRACPGGTLLEAAWWQGRSEEFFEWAGEVGFDCVEVSRGATGLPASSKSGLIARACDHGFEVFAEVGSKDPDEPALPSEWLEEARSDLGCGARWLVAEGRESGTVGLYAADGSVRADLVEALARIGEAAPVVYEAPRRHQQAWLVNHLGRERQPRQHRTVGGARGGGPQERAAVRHPPDQPRPPRPGCDCGPRAGLGPRLAAARPLEPCSIWIRPRPT